MPGTAPANLGVRSVHQNVPLTQMSIGYHPTGLIAEQVFPVIPVKNENDSYYKWDKGQSFRLDRTDGYSTVRPDKSRPKTLQFGATLDSYIAEEFALEMGISDRELQNQDSALNLEVSRLRRVQDLVLLDQELRVSKIALTTGYNSGSITLAGNNQWNDVNFVSMLDSQHSVIKAEIDAGGEVVRIATGGLIPNTIVIPREVAVVMYNDVGLVDLVKYNTNDPQRSLLSNNLLPPELWGMRVLCPTGLADFSDEGEVSNNQSVWGKNLWIGYVNQNPGLDSLTYGMIFRARPWLVKQFRDEFTAQTLYQPGIIQAEKLVASDCGYVMKAVIS
jgi:hypothetical protein